MTSTEADKAALAHLDPVEPDFIAQNGEPLTDAERHTWFSATANDMRSRGAVHFRYSADAQVADRPLALVEGWKAVPANEGEPRWQLAATD